MKGRLVGLIGALTALCGCAAGDVGSNVKPGNEPALVGSYPTKNGGKLEIFEPAPGQFLIGELSYDDEELALVKGPETAQAPTAPANSLAAVYQRRVGGPVPAELLAADARALAGAEAAGESAPPVYVTDLAPGADNDVVDKAVAADSAAFKRDFCRTSNRRPNTSACQSFNICLTEVTGDATFVRSGLFGAYSVVRVLRNRLVMEVLYNDKSFFIRTLDEGARYRTWKSAKQGWDGQQVTPGQPPFKVETRVRSASDTDYNMAMLGTNERRYYDAYNDEAESYGRMGCALVKPADAGSGWVGSFPATW